MNFWGNTSYANLNSVTDQQLWNCLKVSRFQDLENISVIYLSMLWTGIQLKHSFKIKGYFYINCNSGSLSNIAPRVSSRGWIWLLCRTHSSSVHSVLGQIEIKGPAWKETRRIGKFRVWLSVACQTLYEVLYSYTCNSQKLLWSIILHILWV